MNISKKMIACASVCAVLGAGVTAYAAQPAAEESIISQTTVPAVESAAPTEESIPTEPDTFVIEGENAPVEELKVNPPDRNIPSQGDEILNEVYFLHTFSDGITAYIPFDRGTKLDVDYIKKLGSDTPFKDEICYDVVEFLDGTKRYFKIGDSPKEFINIDTLQYGIVSYREGGIGKYYEEVLPDGMILGAWM